jgi:hypothetical protein
MARRLPVILSLLLRILLKNDRKLITTSDISMENNGMITNTDNNVMLINTSENNTENDGKIIIATENNLKNISTTAENFTKNDGKVITTSTENSGKNVSTTAEISTKNTGKIATTAYNDCKITTTENGGKIITVNEGMLRIITRLMLLRMIGNDGMIMAAGEKTTENNGKIYIGMIMNKSENTTENSGKITNYWKKITNDVFGPFEINCAASDVKVRINGKIASTVDFDLRMHSTAINNAVVA